MATASKTGLGFSLLFVEDDPEARPLVMKALSLKFPGLGLLSADNGASGLALFQEQRPDIVLTDIKMPGMDGITMARKIRELHPEALICVLSAYVDSQEFRERAERLDIFDSLVKPVDYRILFATVGRCLETLQENRH